MKLIHRPLVVGNWKMNPGSIKAAKQLFKDVQTVVAKVRNVDIGVAPPMPYLSDLCQEAKGKRLSLFAQDVFWESIGARTGEVSYPMLKSIGVTNAIIGHSERRARGETDEEVNRKVKAVLKGGGKVILCVGEAERDTHGNYLTFVEKQIRSALSSVTKTKLGNVVIAYEPIWAIGTGDTATAHDALEMKIFIQKVLGELFDRGAIAKVRILYGGSVRAANAEKLLREGTVDGFLVGGASLRGSEFASIIKTAHEYGKA